MYISNKEIFAGWLHRFKLKYTWKFIVILIVLIVIPLVYNYKESFKQGSYSEWLMTEYSRLKEYLDEPFNEFEFRVSSERLKSQRLFIEYAYQAHSSLCRVGEDSFVRFEFNEYPPYLWYPTTFYVKELQEAYYEYKSAQLARDSKISTDEYFMYMSDESIPRTEEIDYLLTELDDAYKYWRACYEASHMANRFYIDECNKFRDYYSISDLLLKITIVTTLISELYIVTIKHSLSK